MTKPDFEKWKFAGSLPSHLVLYVGCYPLAGAQAPGFDVSAVQVDDRILMSLVFYTTLKRIHGLLHYEGASQMFFMGYECGLCGEIFLVPDSVNDKRNLAEAMGHGCTFSPADQSAYYERLRKPTL